MRTLKERHALLKSYRWKHGSHMAVEGCGRFILEGEIYSVDEDSVRVCIQCGQPEQGRQTMQEVLIVVAGIGVIYVCGKLFFPDGE